MTTMEENKNKQEPEIEEEVKTEANTEQKEQPVFDPKRYVPDFSYGEGSIFDADFAALDAEELKTYVEKNHSVIREMAESIASLANLVMRNNRRLEQFDDALRILDNTKRDFDNYKRRNADLKVKAEEDGFCKAVKEFLPAVDNIERAVALIQDPAMAEGVLMIERQLKEALERLNVQEIQPIGETFDPNFHNAVMQESTEEEDKNETVTAVFQKGYMVGDTVLRYAQVKVARYQ